MSSAGCLITERPDFTAPEVSRPLLTNFHPSPADILEIPRKPGSSTEVNEYVEKLIRLDVFSEDLQKPLYFAVIIDLLRETQDFICFESKGTGTLAKARELKCPLKIKSSIKPGCHSITALVSHEESVYSGRVANGSDLGMMTWWAQIGVEDSNYWRCEPHTPPTDAGADARADGGRP
jgi:hypothetical protein